MKSQALIKENEAKRGSKIPENLSDRMIMTVEVSLVLFKRSLCVTLEEGLMDKNHVKKEG